MSKQLCSLNIVFMYYRNYHLCEMSCCYHFDSALFSTKKKLTNKGQVSALFFVMLTAKLKAFVPYLKHWISGVVNCFQVYPHTL